jgi:hypothetical protein
MALDYGSIKIACGGIQTRAGTLLTTGTTVLAERVKTNAGTAVFVTGAATKFSAGSLSGFKACLTFRHSLDMVLSTSLNTFLPWSFVGYNGSGGGEIGIATTGKAAYIPWPGSVLGIGVRAITNLSAGNASVTLYNGTTSLGCTVTFNTTSTKNVNGSLKPINTKIFTANNLKVKLKTSAACAPVSANGFFGMVWIEV